MRQSLDIYDDRPRAMTAYLKNYGWHFSKKAYEYAASLMRKRGSSGKLTPVEVFTKEDVDNILSTYDVKLERKEGYDYIFVAQMCRADYLGSSIPDDQHLALYIKDTVDDPDAADGTIMRRWLATMVAAGMPIEWEDLL